MTSRTTPRGRRRLTLLGLLLALSAAASLAPAAEAAYWEYPGITQVRPVEGKGEMTQHFAPVDAGDVASTYTYTSEFFPSRIDQGDSFLFNAKLTMHNPPTDCTPETQTFDEASGSFGIPRTHEGDDVPSLPGVNYFALDYAFYNFGPSQVVSVTQCSGETTELEWSTFVDGSETEVEDNVYSTCYYHLMDDPIASTGYWTPGDAANTGTISVLSIGGAQCTTDACDDEIDEDNDGYDGYPADPGCTSSFDVSENELGHPCDDGIDNDRDASADFRRPYDDPDRDRFSRDLDCESPSDPSEGITECNDTYDNDEDGQTDHPFDPGCTSEGDPSEHEAGHECDDGIDNDADGLIDFQLPLPADMTPPDPNCRDVFDTSEYEPECSDGVHNDQDDLLDMADPGCEGPEDTSELDYVRLTIEISGPGAVDQCVITCTQIYERGRDLSLTAAPDEPKDGFLGWSGCDAAFGTSCHVSLDADRTVGARFDPVVSYAPWMSYHPDEKLWPMDPARFIASSALKWANIGSRKYPPCSATKTVELVPQGRVDARKLSAGSYKRRYCWRTKILGRLGPRQWATFDTADLTSPSIKTKPGTKLGHSGFFLDFAYSQRKSDRPGGKTTPPLYVEYKPRRYVIYWFFSGKNEVDWGNLGRDLHEGDWEHIVVKLGNENRATDAAYYQHICGGDVHSWRKMRDEGWLTDGGHPKVYVALGAHASYPRVPRIGRVPVACFEKKWSPIGGINDFLKKGGTTWKTWSRGSDGFRRGDAQRWYGFGGGWGSDAGSSPDHRPGPFWGPLGPGKLKLSEAVPRGW